MTPAALLRRTTTRRVLSWRSQSRSDTYRSRRRSHHVDRQPLFSQQSFTTNLETQLNRFLRDIYAPTVTEGCSRAGSAPQSWPETPVRTPGSDEIPERTEHRSWSIAGFAVEISSWIARVTLLALSASDGEAVAETPLGAFPVFDGMSVAHGKLFVSDDSGTITCLE